MEAGYVVTEDGDKVLPGSRRPDGTIRRERRIRAGYVPQDEQPVYQSGGVMARRHVPRCPGLDPQEASGGSGGDKSKSAKKNEKRKAKKADDKTGGEGGSSSSQQQQQQPQQTSSSSQPAAAPAAAAPQQAAAAAAGVSGDPGAAALDRAIKALSKKVRQCQSLQERKSKGEALSAQEAEKVAKMPGWQDEIKELEHQLANLGV